MAGNPQHELCASATPFISIVIPAHDAARTLSRALEALEASSHPRDCRELIVVDDASSDDTEAIASRHADVVIRLQGGPRGPAFARNRGVEAARGEVVVFLDADVLVHRDTIARLVELFESRPDMSAAFGSYDAQPAAPGFVSQYRNLLHHYVHQRNAGEVASFWAGAGAVRRAVFDRMGGFDERRFPRPQIEDIELGVRLAGQGHHIVLDPAVLVTHLKRWTLGSVVRTDLRDRGIPWSRLLVRRGRALAVGTLNHRWAERFKVALVWLAVLSSVAGAVRWDAPSAALAATAIAIVVASNWRLWLFFARARGPWFAVRTIPAHLLHLLLNGISFGLGLLQVVGPALASTTAAAWSRAVARPIPMGRKGAVVGSQTAAARVAAKVARVAR